MIFFPENINDARMTVQETQRDGGRIWPRVKTNTDFRLGAHMVGWEKKGPRVKMRGGKK